MLVMKIDLTYVGDENRNNFYAPTFYSRSCNLVLITGLSLLIRSYGKGTGRECMRAVEKVMGMGREPGIFL